jgi:hypothetical protein
MPAVPMIINIPYIKSTWSTARLTHILDRDFSRIYTRESLQGLVVDYRFKTLCGRSIPKFIFVEKRPHKYEICSGCLDVEENGYPTLRRRHHHSWSMGETKSRPPQSIQAPF